MEYFYFAILFALAVEETEQRQTLHRLIPFRRFLPAGVLRDFPGLCFASTRCATIEPGYSWDLTPFCGKSTCVLNEDKPPKLLEMTEDCGPLPSPNSKCKLDPERTNRSAPFPACCPQFSCEDGAKLEYSAS